MCKFGICILCLAAQFSATAHAQQPKPKAMVGAYYFDGWSGKTDEIHLPKLLTTEYADRKPVWGWKDDTVEIMQTADRLLCRPRHRFLGFRLVLPGRRNQDDAAQQRPRFVPEGSQLPTIEVLPTGGKPRRLSHRAEGLERLLREMDRTFPETDPSAIGRAAALDLLLAR